MSIFIASSHINRSIETINVDPIQTVSKSLITSLVIHSRAFDSHHKLNRRDMLLLRAPSPAPSDADPGWQVPNLAMNLARCSWPSGGRTQLQRVDPGHLPPPLLRSTAIQSSLPDGQIPPVTGAAAESGPDPGEPNSSTTQRVQAGS